MQFPTISYLRGHCRLGGIRRLRLSRGPRMVAAIVPAAIIPAASVGQSKKQISDVVGTYHSCLMGCAVITIRPDFTFSYQPMSDVGEPERVEGTWAFEDSNILVANTFEQPNKHPFTTRLNRDQKGFIVRIMGKDKLPLQYAEVRIPTRDGMLIRETDARGTAEFPACAPRGMTVKQPFSD